MSTDYKGILKMAINNEVEAYEFYKQAETKSKDGNLKSIFAELAGEEMKHKKTLEGFLNNEALELNFSVSGPDYKIAESLELPKLTSDMSFSDGVALAIKKEQEAMDMYQQFADASINQAQKNTFLELAKMELGHKVKLEELYNNTAYNEVW
jgi:rubrerythrin